jgi:hypothetical protein
LLTAQKAHIRRLHTQNRPGVPTCCTSRREPVGLDKELPLLEIKLAQELAPLHAPRPRPNATVNSGLVPAKKKRAAVPLEANRRATLFLVTQPVLWDNSSSTYCEIVPRGPRRS